jgi:hypothetical protein
MDSSKTLFQYGAKSLFHAKISCANIMTKRTQVMNDKRTRNSANIPPKAVEDVYDDHAQHNDYPLGKEEIKKQAITDANNAFDKFANEL